MIRMSRTLAVAVVVAAMAAGILSAQAAGALAVGACGAYGFSYDYTTMDGAVDRALDECRGRNCRIVARLRNFCAAFSIDDRNPCGSWGWASRRDLAAAQRTAIRECHSHGGRDCVVRAWVCDRRG